MIFEKVPYNNKYINWSNNHLEPNNTLYSDRLMQWDMVKFNNCLQTVFGNKSQYFSNRDLTDIEKFLRLYNEDETLCLCSIEQLINVSNGYPYWRFEIYKP